MRFVRTTLLLVLGFVAFAAGLARAERVDLIVPLGVAGNSQIAAPGDAVTVGFLVTKGTLRKLSFLVKRGKGSKIVPEVALFDPDGLPFDIATATKGKVSKAGAPTYTATFTDVPKTGLWRFEVRGGAGSVGAFTASVKGKDTLKIPAPKSPPETLQVNGKFDIPIEAGENTALTVSAKRAGGSLVLLQLSVLDRNLNPVAPSVAANPKNGVLSLKGLRLPTFGPYTLRFTGGATGGGFMYAATTSAAKFTRGALPTGTIDPVSAEPLLTTALNGHGAPAAGGALAYRWVQVSGAPVALANPDTASPTFKAPAAGKSLAFQFSVVEGTTLVSKPVTISLDVAKRPIADAGRSQSVAAAAAVALDGSASVDRRGDGLKYSWRQIPGDASTVVLTGAATATPTLTAPNLSGVLHFGLTVDDGFAKSTEDVVVVNVGDPTKAVADAGRDQYVPRMATVHLCGLSSVTPTTVLDAPIAWTKVAGPAVTLAGADTPWPSFTAPKTVADYVFKLTVGGNDAGADTVAVHVRPDETNVPAPAKGNGPLNAAPGNLQLSASATEDLDAADTPKLKYRWAQLSGAPLALSDAFSATANVVMVAGAGEYQFAVQAVDRLQFGAPDIVTVRSLGFTGKPIAVAGVNPPPVALGATTTLDGRASARTDGGTDPLSFQWTQVSCKDWFDFAASSAVFNPTAAVLNVTLPTDVSSLTNTRTVLFKLVVNDGTTSSAPDFVAVTYTSLLTNGVPTVTVVNRDIAALTGDVVTLAATSFDRDGDPMTYQWSQTQGPPVALSPNSRALSPTFVAPASPTLRFNCVANDGIEDGSPSQTITVTVDLPPVANIVVTPTNGPPGTQVSMDGAAANTPSFDPEGQPLTYAWRQISGTTVTLQATNTPAISFAAPTGAVTFGLKVTDVKGQVSSEKTAGFSANTPPAVSPSITSSVDTTVMPTALGVSGSFASYGSTVAFSANGSGGNGTPLSYTWRVISQSPATMSTISLSSNSSAVPTFTVPTPTSAGAFGQAPQATFGVTATDGTQTSPEGTVTVRFFVSLSNATTAAAATPTSTVYGIVSGTCTQCHTGTGNSCPVGSGSSAGGYGMASPTAFRNNSRGVLSCVATSTFRVPVSLGSSSNSYLIQRLKGIATPAMPSTGSLSAAQIALFQDWVDQGSAAN